MMIISEGSQHTGKPAELAVISFPYFVKTVLDCRCKDGDMPLLRQEFLRLISLFDQKRLHTACRNCSEPARLLVFYKGTLFHEAWCAECRPIWLGREQWKFDIFSDYISALDYVDYYCRGEKFFYKKIIRNIAHLKGLPRRAGQKEALSFFSI